MQTYVCVSGGKKVNFSENFVYVLNKWPHIEITTCTSVICTRYILTITNSTGKKNKLTNIKNVEYKLWNKKIKKIGLHYSKMLLSIPKNLFYYYILSIKIHHFHVFDIPNFTLSHIINDELD